MRKAFLIILAVLLATSLFVSCGGDPAPVPPVPPAPTEYKINVTQVTGGTLTPEKTTYIESDTLQVIHLEITPDEDYYFHGVTVEGNATYLFQRIYIPKGAKGDITLTPKFEKKPEEVVYIDVTWTPEHGIQSTEESTDSFSLLTKDDVEWKDGFYVLTGDVKITDRINVTGDAKLILCDGRILTAEKGITVADGKSLTIYGQKNSSGALKTGAIDAGFAAIGGTGEADSGDMFFKGGIIEVTGGDSGAGIGGGINHKSGDIEIYRGQIKATGGDSAPGIGAGRDSDGENITIYDGNVTANGGSFGCGIGAGFSGCGGNITIHEGTVIATGGLSNSGIGDGGYTEKLGKITITGGKVIATAGWYGAGIGGSGGTMGGEITISGGDITATGGTGAAGIGGGTHKSATKITISGEMTAIVAVGGSGPGEAGAGIGGGSYCTGGEITISGGNITATGGSDGGAGIGGGTTCNDGGIITISGGTVFATGGNGNADGIGRGDRLGYDTAHGTLKITDNHVVLFGGKDRDHKAELSYVVNEPYSYPEGDDKTLSYMEIITNP